MLQGPKALVFSLILARLLPQGPCDCRAQPSRAQTYSNPQLFAKKLFLEGP